MVLNSWAHSWRTARRHFSIILQANIGESVREDSNRGACSTHDAPSGDTGSPRGVFLLTYTVVRIQLNLRSITEKISPMGAKRREYSMQVECAAVPVLQGRKRQHTRCQHSLLDAASASLQCVPQCQMLSGRLIVQTGTKLTTASIGTQTEGVELLSYFE